MITLLLTASILIIVAIFANKLANNQITAQHNYFRILWGKKYIKYKHLVP